LASTARTDIDRIVALARAYFEDVRVIRKDATEERAIVEVHCVYGPYTIRLREVTAPTHRRYSYYIFNGKRIVAGFDNSSDRPAIRLKYGADWLAHIHDFVPHAHFDDKRRLELTTEMSCEDFIAWIKAHLPLDRALSK